MYDFVFWVLYMANLKDGRGYGRYNGVSIVTLAIILHTLLVLAVVKKIFSRQFESSNLKEWFNNNKLFTFYFLYRLGI